MDLDEKDGPDWKKVSRFVSMTLLIFRGFGIFLEMTGGHEIKFFPIYLLEQFLRSISFPFT